MPDTNTLALVALLVLALAAVLVVLERLVNRRPPRDPVERRRGHAAAARTSTRVALVCVGLLLVALFLGRILLGAMALTGLVVFAVLAVVRGRLSR